MRQRGHFIGVWLDDGEYRHLTRQCAVTGLTASAFIRKHVMGAELRPRPPDAYAALLQQLSGIGNNVNRALVRAIAKPAWQPGSETLTLSVIY